MTSDNLGIWGNETCLQCGACCYDYNRGNLCRYQEIKSGRSYCKMHESKERDPLCRVWFCSDINDLSSSIEGVEEIKADMRETAELLGTRQI